MKEESRLPQHKFILGVVHTLEIQIWYKHVNLNKRFKPVTSPVTLTAEMICLTTLTVLWLQTRYCNVNDEPSVSWRWRSNLWRVCSSSVQLLGRYFWVAVVTRWMVLGTRNQKYLIWKNNPWKCPRNIAGWGREESQRSTNSKWQLGLLAQNCSWLVSSTMPRSVSDRLTQVRSNKSWAEKRL